MINLETLKNRDYSKVVEYENTFFNPLDDSDFLQSFINNPLYMTYGIYKFDYFIGYIIIWLDEDKSQIFSMMINEEYRRNGYAFKALMTLKLLLKEKGIKDWTLEVRQSNLPAIKLYEKVGFKKVSIRKNYYKNNEDAWLMYKEI